jgi:FemAB-related protein (PEP-CTERM system-associated)
MSAVPEALPITVRDLDAATAGAWDRFVRARPEGTFFHLSGWRQVLERGLGHDTHYLVAERGGEIAGVLPLAHVHSWLFGNTLVSTPFCVYGGAIAVDAAAREALDAEACRRAEQLRVDCLEMRERTARHPDWPAKRDRYVTFRKEIDADPDKNLQQIPRKQRAMIRKGIKFGLEGRIDDDLERFYPVFAESVRNLGTPVFAKRYFRELREAFGEDCEILTIEHEGRVVASVMSFYFRDEVLPYHGGGTRDARRLNANDFLYWDLMRRAAERGLRTFDYGRSKVGTGSYDFKRHWGFTPEPLHYEYHLVRADAVPDVSPLNPKYRLFIGAWQRLPLSLSRLIGPPLARSLG